MMKQPNENLNIVIIRILSERVGEKKGPKLVCELVYPIVRSVFVLIKRRLALITGGAGDPPRFQFPIRLIIFA